MISNREIKGQIDELTEQNQLLTQELQEIKELLQNQDSNQNQASNKNKSDQQAQSSNNSNSSSENQSDASGSKNENTDNQIFNIANDFIKLKGLIGSLEKKMQEYTSTNSKGKSLTEEDVINLMLAMMNGMIDWTVDFVSTQNSKKATPLQ